MWIPEFGKSITGKGTYFVTEVDFFLLESIEQHTGSLFNTLNIAQIWSCHTEYSSFVVNRHPAMYVISRVGENNCKIKIFNNKTIILQNIP